LKARDWSWLQAAELGSNSNYAYYACAGNSLAPEFFSAIPTPQEVRQRLNLQ